ncbi:MAG: oligopeptidase A [Acidiferrobacterales bacterium]
MAQIMNEANNPLLDFSGLPRFTEIRPEHVEPALDVVLARNRAERENLLAAGRHHTWESFAQPMEDMDERLGRLWSPVSHLNAVMNSESLRAVYNRCLPKLSDYQTELGQDERVYRAYKTIAADPAFAALSDAQKKIIEHTLRDFRLSGAELDPADKQRFKEIQQELSTLASRFEENVLDATNGWGLLVTDANDLAGLPESARSAARQAAEEEGKIGWKFSLHGPSYIAFMSYADQRELRRTMYEAYVTRASDQGPQAGRWENGEVINRMLALRAEEAHLLGYPHYAALSLVTKMAKDTGEVMGFLRGLAARSRPTAQAELAELRAFAAAEFGVTGLEAWDITYYSEKLRERRYAFSDEDLRPYFPMPQVVAGMFSVVRRLYGLDVTPVDNPQVWHPDVRFYEIRDAHGEVRGRFYMDLYPRSGKRGGAWMDDCISRKRTLAGVQVPVAYLVCNFTAPVGDAPALLTHDEVTTLFHEFGHGLHHMLTRVDYVGVSGINGVAWDAVELPSQFMENWCWERQALDGLARHYRTGKPLPQELYTKMIAARNFQSGMQMVRQLEFALFDMRLHSDFDPDAGRSVQALLDEVREEVAVLRPPAFSRFHNSFSHIFAGGYAAGYYSYKWAEVLSADAFSKFEENGIFDRRTGEEFLHNILEQGGAYEPMDLFIRFRGREPNIDALLRHSGLAA